MLSNWTVSIVGAGQSGYWAAKTLRAEGFAGRIIVLGDESHRPYQRPPLSKSVLKGEAHMDSVFLAREDGLERLSVEFRPGCSVERIDRVAARLDLLSGERIPYDQLILTTGGSPRRLPAAEKAPIFYLRTIEDAVAIRARCRAGGHALIVGGGLIGLEVAAAARAFGCAVTVIEAAERIMARTVLPNTSAHLAAVHRRHGVAIFTELVPVQINGNECHVRVTCSEGTVLEGDFLVVGIGIVTNDRLAAESGLVTGDGIWVDEHCRTSDPNILAAGDVTNHLNPFLSRRLRLESWQNAQNQAIVAAKNTLGLATRYAEIPWGWSDQFDINLQMLGSPHGVVRTIVRVEPGTDAFTVFGLDGEGRLACVNAVNAPRNIAMSRRLIGRQIPADALEHAGRSLRELVA